MKSKTSAATQFISQQEKNDNKNAKLRPNDPAAWAALVSDRYSSAAQGNNFDNTTQTSRIANGSVSSDTQGRYEVLLFPGTASLTVLPPASSGFTTVSVSSLQLTGDLTQRVILQQIADATGGEAYFPTSVTEVDKIYEHVVAEIRAQYALGYVSTNDKMDGTWRKVNIKVTRPDAKDLKIRSRKGYFAPYRDGSQPRPAGR